MRMEVRQEAEAVIDAYFPNGELNGWLKTFLADKAGEQAIWSELTLLVHWMLGGQSPSITRIAALTELIVLSADIADDLQDQDNAEKAWMQCPPAYAWNTVLALLMGAVAELSRLTGASEGGPLTEVVSRFLAQSINGQHSDISGTIVTEQDYIAMVTDKAGALLRLTYYMGYASTGKADSRTSELLDEIACCGGIAAQIRNDARDVLNIGGKNDLLQRKRTLPVLFLLKHGAEEFPAIGAYYEGAMSEEAFLAQQEACSAYIRESGCLEYAATIQRLYIQRAEELFESLDVQSPWKEQFRELVLQQ